MGLSDAPLSGSEQGAWMSWDGEAAISEADQGWSIRLGVHTFGPTEDTRALGAMCWALGLDDRLFGPENTQVGSGRWLVWHFCALVSRWQDPGIEKFACDGLNAALVLVGDAPLNLEARFKARLRAAELYRRQGTKKTV